MMIRLFAPLLVVIAFVVLAAPAFADDAKSAFLSYLRTTYNAKSIKQIAQYLPEDLASRINSQNNPEAEKQSLSAYRSRYLGNVKFQYDQAVDPSTEALSGTGTDISGIPNTFQVTMVKEKDGWKVREWTYQPDTAFIMKHRRELGLIR
jgi:hypothetical protein